jgi:hypothetical protein
VIKSEAALKTKEAASIPGYEEEHGVLHAERTREPSLCLVSRTRSGSAWRIAILEVGAREAKGVTTS